MRYLAILLGACASNATTVDVAMDLPSNDSASAFPLDQLTISIAHAGSSVDVASASFTHGQGVEIAGAPFGDDLVIHMTGHVGSSEVAYGRTCTFAIEQAGAVPSPHLYFSREVKFGDMTYMPAPRSGGTAVSYHDGSGIIIGGHDPGMVNSPVTDVERFDPRTGEFVVLATLERPVLDPVATTLGSGNEQRVVLVGGIDPMTGGGAQFVQLVDADNPPNRRIDSISDTNMKRIDLTATPLTDGRIVVIGGVPPDGSTIMGEVAMIATTSGSAGVRMLRETQWLKVPRYRHTATRLGNDIGAPVLVVGGLDHLFQPVDVAELFKPLSESFADPATFAPKLVVPRSRHQAVRMPDGSVLILGGLDATNKAVERPELFTLDAGFTALEPLPLNAGLIDFTATPLPDGRVLLTGGRRSLDQADPPLDTAFIASLDPLTGRVDVVATDRLSAPRAGHQATLLCDGTVLLTGGTTDPGVPAERYNPPAVGRR